MGRLDQYNIAFYAARVAANLSQAEVAKAAGLPRGSIVEMETGRTVDPYPREAYVKAARVLGVAVEKILPHSTANLIVKALHHFQGTQARDERALGLLIAMTSDPDVAPADRDFLSVELATAHLATMHDAARPTTPVAKADGLHKAAEAIDELDAAIADLQAQAERLDPRDPLGERDRRVLAREVLKLIDEKNRLTKPPAISAGSSGTVGDAPRTRTVRGGAFADDPNTTFHTTAKARGAR